MPLSKKVLEDSVRLARIRRIKMTLYIVQIIMLVALAFFLVFVIGDATVTPRLYLPIDQFAAVMVLLLLVVCVESFFFRMMEIRFARSSSARHLMSKNSINRSILIAIVATVVTIVLMVQPILAVTEEASQKTVTVVSTEDFSFWSRDPLALQSVSELRATSTETVEVYIVEDAIYQQYEGDVGDMFFMRLNRQDYQVSGTLAIPIEVVGNIELHVVVNDLSAPGASVIVDIVKDTSDTITGIVSVLSLAFIVTNVAWVAYLIPIERKYAVGSIYK